MKLNTVVLEKFIELPSQEPAEIRSLLDDVGLEVKDIETTPGGTTFTIETLANRGDHLYALGVARELSARLLTHVRYPRVSDLTERRSSFPVRKATPLCMRYALLELSLPKGMSLREDVAQVVGGDDKRHPIVDILNYVALEFGQPMHAFDRDKVEGEVVIDVTSGWEEIDGLDGKRYRVPPESIVIRDRTRIIAVAGVIGCANTMVSPSTTRVLIESASFDPVHVRKTARAMGISTDASYTFERGCDIEAVLPALKRLVYLVESDGTGAQQVGLSYVEGDTVEKRKISLRIATIRKQMNLPRLNDVEITTRLKNLGYNLDGVQSGSKEFSVGVPSWRLWDVRNEEDLVEDFARSHGLNGVKLELPALDYDAPEFNETEQLLRTVENSLLGGGFYEVISRAFYSQDDVELLANLDGKIAEKHITLKNSLERGYSHVKTTNILHLADLASHNVKMGVPSVKIFEFGRLFRVAESGARYEFERDVLSLAAAGRWYEHEWRKGESLEECFALFKGVIESIFASLGRSFSVGESKHPLLHPGFQGSVIAGREAAGFFGLVHPVIKEKRDLRADILYAEFEGETLFKSSPERTFSLPVDFPSIKRDLTLAIKPGSLAGKAVGFIRALKPENLTDVYIADDFRKEGEAIRRVTYRLVFQNAERTLEHAEVDLQIAQLLKGLAEKHSLALA